MNCFICTNSLTERQRKFCSTKCKSKDANRRLQNYEAQRHRAHIRKVRLVNDKGGSCRKCYYNKNLAALTFHHTDPTTKSFDLDSRNLSNRTLKSILLESEKCELLCLNCHMEHHHPSHAGWMNWLLREDLNL